MLEVVTPAEQVAPSARLVEVGLRFGVPLSVPGRPLARLALAFAPGTITLVTGPSGSGKSLLLGEIGKRFAAARLVNNVQFPLDVAVLDAVAPTRPITEALELLTATGLGEPMLWIRRFNQLSDGERFRARLARAIALHRSGGRGGPLLCDEFAALLHRRVAKAIAFNLRKLAWREGLTLVVATSQDDLETDLRPDCVVRMGGEAAVVEERVQVNAQRPAKRMHLPQTQDFADNLSISLAGRLRIGRGTLSDYQRFAGMHYRQRENVGFIDKVFVLREETSGVQLGIVVYGHAALELTLRNQATGGRFVRRPRRLNREVRVLKRLVIHPDVRGCGLGHWLVRRTLPLAGTRFVECLAAMGAINPVFEKAGMRRIGVCRPPVGRERTVRRLSELGADPLAADFVMQVCRRPAVRRLVAATVSDWYRATTSSDGWERTNRQTPVTLAQTFRQMVGSEPVYYLWSNDGRGAQLIERGLAQRVEEPDAGI